ncbi:hypothetical protein MTR_8g030737 [Medicago truncatula]|uniref:Uncharacterized protein n=1 Tax=Medicago truncatula TaxID=3880 RepID=A0A072TNW7_MEDTR|nr:hypothetical protein MTR_8g030737 [Medicago truncatula]
MEEEKTLEVEVEELLEEEDVETSINGETIISRGRGGNNFGSTNRGRERGTKQPIANTTSGKRGRKFISKH